jgi:hypothetical protein
MNTSNPSVQHSAETTLNQVINSLDYIIGTLPETPDDNVDAHQAGLTTTQMAGLRQILTSLKETTENGFGLYLSERNNS